LFSLINCGALKGGVFQYALTFIEDFVRFSDDRLELIVLIDDKSYLNFIPPNVEIILIESIPAANNRYKRLLYTLSNYGFLPKRFGVFDYHKRIKLIKPDYLISLNQRPDNYYSEIKGITVIHDAPRCWNKISRKVHPLGYSVQFDSECARILATNNTITLVESSEAKEMIKSSSYKKNAAVKSLPFRVLNFKFSKPSEDFEKQVQSLGNYLYYPSTTHPVKNHLKLIDAIELYNQFSKESLALVMTGPKDMYTQIILDYSIGKIEAFHLGYVDETEKRHLYLNSKGLTIPSLFNFGNIPILEAVQLNIPFLASNYSSVIDSSKNLGFYVNPNFVDSIASGIYRMIHSRTTSFDHNDSREESFKTLLENLMEL